MSRIRGACVVALLALPLAELGHLVAYWPRVRPQGSHQWFPALLHLAGAGLGAALLVTLAALAAARLLTGTSARRPGWSLAVLFTSLLVLQMLVFLVQEGLEIQSLPGGETLAAGLLGQQPVAIVGALALHWLSARLGPALAALAGSVPRRGRPSVVICLGSGPEPIAAPAAQPQRSRASRGPPGFLPH